MAHKKSSEHSKKANVQPTKQDILEFLNESPGKTGKREIARAFGISGNDRIVLKRLLAEMADEGLLSGRKNALRESGKLPAQTVLQVTGRDADGDLLAKPVRWDPGDGKMPVVRLALRQNKSDAQIGVSDRLLAKIKKLSRSSGGAAYEAPPIKKFERDSRSLLGIFRSSAKGGGSIKPIDRKSLKSWSVKASDTSDAKDGDLVRYAIGRRGHGMANSAEILESLGNPDDERQISLIAIHAHGIPEDFPESVIKAADELALPKLGKRTDRRKLPLVTIDPEDARDHDDAVHAEPDSDKSNSGGWLVTVAIADVAYFVRPDSKLDREAQLRGNSVYFPDRVVPMLPERISNDLCSLREGEERACLAVEMCFDKNGNKKSHRFMRAMMRSAAKLSYQEAQAAIDGQTNDKTGPLLEPVLKPLWAAYSALAKARDKRQPLDLDLPERKIVLDKTGHVADIVTPQRLDAHRLIEEFMIQANVAAAEALEGTGIRLIYRVHDQPSDEKFKALKDFLDTLSMKIPNKGQLRAAAFNRILGQSADLPHADLINEVVLRSQSQAEYAPDNIGHFGLNLARYAHFTSPIRRYADLVVHRALIRALGLGEGGLTDEEIDRLRTVASAISDTERRAMAAERETTDRLIAAHLADQVGATFEGTIAGVTRSGLFVKLTKPGTDGFIPISTLDDDYYHHVEAARALVGSRSKKSYQLGDDVSVRLIEAIPSAGALRFEMLSPPRKSMTAAATPREQRVLSRRGRTGKKGTHSRAKRKKTR